MRELFFVGWLTALVFGIGCSDNLKDFDPTEDPLTGMIGGEEWTYTKGRVAFSNTSNFASGLILAENTNDPCAVVATVNPHVSLSFPAIRGNYTLSVDNVEVVFNLQGGSVKLTAPSGFLEIVSVAGTEVIGFLSAYLDDENSVEGTFVMNACN